MIYLLDTCALVSAFARLETAFKRWAEALLRTIRLPLATCEPVVTEAAHMLGSGDRLLEAMHRGLLQIGIGASRRRHEHQHAQRGDAGIAKDVAGGYFAPAATLRRSNPGGRV